MKYRPLTPLSAIALFLACAPGRLPAERPDPPPAPTWQRDALWDDGKAEIARYEATEPRYGIQRPFTLHVIVVKEPFRTDEWVKAESPGAPTIEVLKSNWVRSVQTGIYRYEQMFSSFLARDDLQPVKVSLAMFEWCGNSYKEWLRETGALEYHTYWEGQARGTFPLVASPSLYFYDDLGVRLRGLGALESGRFEIDVVDTLVHSKAPPPRLERATVEVVGQETLDLPAGRFEARKVVLRRGEAVDTLWFKVEAPHLLLRWDRSDGGRYRLAGVERLAYWEMNGPDFDGYMVGGADGGSKP
ncbi:MAG: hypothetical protein D6729_11105 [Deltaproteobacteria bacterium]|nr:MAG: hypothetical protein D6729_11105 [Deltaproteobacteria bacterium]